jgi:hypothetical protein
MNSPVEMLLNLKEMQGRLNRLVHALACECDEVDELWVGLGQAGGQREDHAASLLQRLNPHLVGIAKFCETCNVQIGQMAADPFQRKAA